MKREMKKQKLVAYEKTVVKLEAKLDYVKKMLKALKNEVKKNG